MGARGKRPTVTRYLRQDGDPRTDAFFADAGVAHQEGRPPEGRSREAHRPPHPPLVLPCGPVLSRGD